MEDVVPPVKDTPSAGRVGPGGCERCGRLDVVPYGDLWLCADCVHTAGSCCPEFGAWDMWSTTDQPLQDPVTRRAS